MEASRLNKNDKRSSHYFLSILLHLTLLGVLIVYGTLQDRSGKTQDSISIEMFSPPPKEAVVKLVQKLTVVKSPTFNERAITPMSSALETQASVVAETKLNFEQELRNALDRAKRYPPTAKARRQTGRINISFTVRKNGEITDVKILDPSIFTLLNEAALETVMRVGHFKPIPDEVSLRDWNVIVPIDFRLSTTSERK